MFVLHFSSSGLWLEGKWIPSLSSVCQSSAEVQVWAALNHHFHHPLLSSSLLQTPLTRRKQLVSEEGKEDQTIRPEGSAHSRYLLLPPPVQALMKQGQVTAILPQPLHPCPLPPPPPPVFVCLCKCPWPGGLWWGGSPGCVAPAASSWTTAGHRGCMLDPAERRRHRDAPTMMPGT